MRWDSSGCIPPKEWIELAHHVYPDEVDPVACAAADDEDMAVFREEYRKARANISDEQRREEAVERRAAFGPGHNVVDVITGEVFRT